MPQSVFIPSLLKLSQHQKNNFSFDKNFSKHSIFGIIQHIIIYVSVFLFAAAESEKKTSLVCICSIILEGECFEQAFG